MGLNQALIDAPFGRSSGLQTGTQSLSSAELEVLLTTLSSTASRETESHFHCVSRLLQMSLATALTTTRQLTDVSPFSSAAARNATNRCCRRAFGSAAMLLHRTLRVKRGSRGATWTQPAVCVALRCVVCILNDDTIIWTTKAATTLRQCAGSCPLERSYAAGLAPLWSK